MNLEKLLKPKSIAIVGASDSAGFGGACCKNIEMYMEDTSNIFYVNPKRDFLRDKKCYNNICDIPYNIDLVVIATNKSTVKNIIFDGLKKDIKSYIVYASGFSECEDGVTLENELKELAIRYDITIMGPNCAGYCNFIDNINLFAFLSEKRNRKGHIGIVSQSGMIGLSLLDNQMLKFSYNISCGNANIVTFTDYINFLIDDLETYVIGLYADGIKDIESIEKCFKRAYEKNKRIVILKMGISDKSKLLSFNHTGTTENFSDKEFNELIEKYNVLRVYDLEEFIYTLLAVNYSPINKRINGIASLNLSGGEANIATEVGGLYNMNFPSFTNDTIIYLKDRLPSYAHISNPLDMTVTLSYDENALADALDVIMSEDNIDIILFGYTLLRQIDDPCIYYLIKAIEILKDRKKKKMKPVFIMSFFSCTREQESIEKLLNLGVVVFPTPIYAFKILKNMK